MKSSVKRSKSRIDNLGDVVRGDRRQVHKGGYDLGDKIKGLDRIKGLGWGTRGL